MSPVPKISILIPAFNEAPTIEANLAEVSRTMLALGYDFEVIVIDDGSLDGTYERARRAANALSERFLVLRHNPNRGKGYALLSGARHARGNVVAFLDADLDLHPAQLASFLTIMERDRADIVIGSKRHPASRVAYPLSRKISSALYFDLVAVLFRLPVRDTQTGLKLFKRDVLVRIAPLVLVERFAFDVELLVNAHLKGYKIVEAPVEVTFRRRTGRLRWGDAFQTLLDTFAVYFQTHALRRRRRPQAS